MLARVDDNALDAGPKKAGPQRLCVVTREVKPTGELIRFVLGPDGEVVPDLKQRLPGRGLWVTAEREVLAVAVKRKAFARGFKREVRVPGDLVAQTQALLERAALDALAIAGKAGWVAAGFSKVEAAIAREPLAALIHAADAGADGAAKLAAALRRSFGEDAEAVPRITAFTSEQLDLALGRSNVVHAALLAGPSTNTFLARLRRLERFKDRRAGGRLCAQVDGNARTLDS